MNINKHTSWLLMLFVGVLAACDTPEAIHQTAISSYFQRLSPCDTIRVEVLAEDEVLASCTTIPNSIFFKTVPKKLLADIDYIADSAESQVRGYYFFSLSKNMTAYWVETRLSWFQNHSLFLYDNTRKQFVDRITLAEWYGGESGQVLIGSGIFDYNGDGQWDIFSKEIQHSMRLSENSEEPIEETAESVQIRLWKKDHFENLSITDTASVMNKYHIRSYW